jgi:hypothetical protein
MSTEVAPSNPTPRASYELENRSSATWNRNVDDKVEVVLPSKDLECPDIRPASIDDSSAISTRHSYPPTMPINESSKPTKEQVMRGRLYFGAVCFSFFLGGWNDAATVCGSITRVLPILTNSIAGSTAPSNPACI